MNKMTGCEVWRTAGGGGTPYADWKQVNADGFGAAANDEATSMIGFGVSLYVGTANPGGGQLLLTAGVGGPPYTDWAPAVAPGFGNAANIAITALAPFTSGNGFLHAGTRNLAGCEVWAQNAPGAWARVDGPAGPGGPPYTDWTLVSAVGFGNAKNLFVYSLAVMGSGLYAGTYNAMEGCEVWRAKSNAWYLAEGSTDGGMETFVLVQNPGTSPVHVNIKFQTGAGERAPADLQGAVIDPTSRRTFKVNNYVTDFNVSTFVEATDGEVICERAIYGDSRTWAHDSIGFSP